MNKMHKKIIRLLIIVCALFGLGFTSSSVHAAVSESDIKAKALLQGLVYCYQTGARNEIKISKFEF